MQYGIDYPRETLIRQPVKCIYGLNPDNPVVSFPRIPVINKHRVIVLSFIMTSLKPGCNTILNPVFSENIFIVVPALLKKHYAFISSLRGIIDS